MRSDFLVENFTIPPHPYGVSLEGKTVRLEGLDVAKHSEELFNANSLDTLGENWKYLPYGPFHAVEDFQNWMSEEVRNTDPTFFAIVRKSDGKAVGVASYLRINQQMALLR